MNIGGAIVTVILIIIFLGVTSGLYPVFIGYINNVTAEGWAGTALLVILGTLYWIIVSAVVILGFLEGFGLMEMIHKFKKFK